MYSADQPTSIIRSVTELETYLAQRGLNWETAKLPDKSLFATSFPLRLPTFFADLIDWRDPLDPLRLQVIPTSLEKNNHTYELSDPIGDQVREAVPGLIHRYPDRCLLLLTTYCLVHCRFCFRREVVGKIRPVQFKHIQNYLSQQTAVRELIFSGGDPFTFPIGFLDSLIQHFANIQHIKIWRFHSRVPTVNPLTISAEWIALLQKLSTQFGIKVVVVIHINHPREFTAECRTIIDQLLAAGCLVLSQTVLLKGVNTTSEVLSTLFREVVLAGVKPYYLHHLDQVIGTHHFRISIEQGKQLFQSLRGHLSGICLPEYVIDLPGGHGKVPVYWLEKIADKIYQVTNFEQKHITYVDHAEE